MEVSEQGDIIVRLLHGLGYKALPADDLIETGIGGLRVLISLRPPSSIQLYAGFLREYSADFDLEAANAFNRRYRFVKCYLNETAISFEGDYHIDVQSDDVRRRLAEIVVSFEVSVKFIDRAIAKPADILGEE